MVWKSILFPETEFSIDKQLSEAPVYLNDLYLDQIIQAITDKRENLRPLFYTSIHDANVIRYRHEVMQDLECETLLNRIKAFAANINSAVRSVNSISESIVQENRQYYNYLEKGQLLWAAKTYCEEIQSFMENLSMFNIKSKGLSEFLKYTSKYAKSGFFTLLLSDTNTMKNDLSTVKYCMLIKGNCIKVRKYEDEPDYSTEIEEIFQKFKQETSKEHKKKMSERPYAEHVEAGVLDLVAELYPAIFSRLDEYAAKYKDFIDKTIRAFSEEVQFYIAYLEYISKFKQMGLQFCYPEMLENSKEIFNEEGFDLALANNLIDKRVPVVCNDFYFHSNERIIIISGPNQGGKTTFARAFGQMHHLASLGCPVPGRKAALYLFDNIFTHFEREESIQTFNGKLQDELVRMKDILCHATSHSIIIINEILSSTTLKDAISIGKKIISEVAKLDSLCVCVTFIDELTAVSKKIVSMVSTVVPEEPVRRTFKIVRNPSDGLAYAIHIAEKHRVTYQDLKERIKT